MRASVAFHLLLWRRIMTSRKLKAINSLGAGLSALVVVLIYLASKDSSAIPAESDAVNGGVVSRHIESQKAVSVEPDVEIVGEHQLDQYALAKLGALPGLTPEQSIEELNSQHAEMRAEALEVQRIVLLHLSEGAEAAAEAAAQSTKFQSAMRRAGQ